MVKAGIGSGFNNSSEIHVMSYKQEIQSKNAYKWKEEVEKEYQRMVEHSLWTAIKISKVPKGAILIMKTKSNGKLQGRFNAKGFYQVPGKLFNASSIAVLVGG